MTQYPFQHKMLDFLPSNYIPSDKDILCGRGKIYAKHPGNKHFSDTVLNNLQRYKTAHKRIARSEVVASIVKQFRTTGLRFIKRDKEKNQWYELTSEAAHEKTGHAIRDLLKALEAQALGNPKACVKKRSRHSRTPSPNKTYNLTRVTEIPHIPAWRTTREASPVARIAPQNFQIDDDNTAPILPSFIQRVTSDPLADPFMSAQLLEVLSDDDEKDVNKKQNHSSNDYFRPTVTTNLQQPATILNQDNVIYSSRTNASLDPHHPGNTQLAPLHIAAESGLECDEMSMVLDALRRGNFERQS